MFSKTQDRIQIKRDKKVQIHNPEKANNAKYSKTKLPWFSRLLRLSARKRGGLILQCFEPTNGVLLETCSIDAGWLNQWLQVLVTKQTLVPHDHWESGCYKNLDLHINNIFTTRVLNQINNLKMTGKGFYRKRVKSSFEQFITTQTRVGSTNGWKI